MTPVSSGDVALKVLSPGLLADEDPHKRFRREALRRVTFPPPYFSSWQSRN